MTPPECPLCDRELGIDNESHIYECHRAQMCAAILAEREACAKIAEKFAIGSHGGFKAAAIDVAAAIRARPAP